MPNKDGTGPFGKGPKTGKQLGKCSGAKPEEGFRNCSGRRCRKNKMCCEEKE